MKLKKGENIMKSKIAQAIKLNTSPVAVLWSDEKPEGAVQFKEDKWGCVISMLSAASKGTVAAFDENTTGCNGGATGLGFKSFELGFIEHFLSTGIPGKVEGEHYRKNPDMAKGFVSTLSKIKVPTKYVIFKPIDLVGEDEKLEAVIFLVNADQLSACVTLANFDKPTQDNVLIQAAAGCHQTVLEVIAQGYKDEPKAIVGLSDISARKMVDKDLLSFSLPYKRYVELEDLVEESFLTKKEWLEITKRI